MAAFGVHGRAARGAPLGRGPGGRRLDGRRRALVAGDGRRRLPVRRRGPEARRRASSPARFVCYLPYEAADGHVTMGALEPQFWARFCDGVGREDLVEKQFERAGSEAWARGRRDLPLAHARRVEGVQRRARRDDRAGPRPRRGARLRARARARDGGRVGAAGARAGAPARRAGEALAHPGRPSTRRRRRSASTPRRCCARPASTTSEIGAAARVRRRRRAGRGGDGGRGSWR